MKVGRGVLMAITLTLLLAAYVWSGTKGNLTIDLDKPILVGDKTVGPGKCQIAWATQSQETDLRFFIHGKVVAEVNGRMVETDSKADYDGLITVENAEGKQVLKGLQFAGKKSVIRLHEPGRAEVR